jgi:hypothetical protein
MNKNPIYLLALTGSPDAALAAFDYFSLESFNTLNLAGSSRPGNPINTCGTRRF